MITQKEADEIRKILKDTPGWDDLRDCFPKFGEIIDALPDTSKVKEINSMLQDVLCDALARARRWSYGSIKIEDIIQESKSKTIQQLEDDRKQLFELANSYAGDEYGRIAVMIHRVCDCLLDEIENQEAKP